MTLFKKVRELLTARDADDIVVFGGGIIPQADLQPLAELGVHKIFTPGATTVEIVEWVRANVGDASATEAEPSATEAEPSEAGSKEAEPTAVEPAGAESAGTTQDA
jgi:hypothetical protein